MSKELPRHLSAEHRAALAPFAAIMAGAYAMLSELTDAELLVLREACESVSSVNCWFMSYDAANTFSGEVSRLIRERGIDNPEVAP